ncbi:multicilin isoform X2 [Betta splendens]|uniref:Multicilin n=1 Tax=Betta splendens TaxID=158456 RepID=A0A6P7NHT1_BETSP|nr:multicilin isoform X2 [Betta splendens]
MEAHRDRRAFGAVCPNQMGHRGGKAAVKKNKVLVPRSSSPVAVYVEFPCIVEQAFSTIAWDGLGECASVARTDSDSLGSRVNESDLEDQDFGDYALDFMADSPATLESSLSSAELVPFQGCVIPPLTPQQDFSLEESLVDSSTDADKPCAQDGGPWEGIAQSHGRALGNAMVVNDQLHETLHRRREEMDSLHERNLQLRLLANRAKHLASVLEKLMTVKEAHVGETAAARGDNPSLSPCKRQRLGEGHDAPASDSVEDVLRDVSTRCNAVLHGSAGGTASGTARGGGAEESETVRVFGAFPGLQPLITSSTGGAQTEDSTSSFKTSVKEHCTIRTQVFPHGRAFTSRTQQGGYRFRWVPNHC